MKVCSYRSETVRERIIKKKTHEQILNKTNYRDKVLNNLSPLLLFLFFKCFHNNILLNKVLFKNFIDNLLIHNCCNLMIIQIR